jgi:hypothetical protein
MVMLRTLVTIIALIWWGFAVAEVTVLRQVQVIYDGSPTLRIRAFGFDVDVNSVLLDISAYRSPSLILGTDFTLSVHDDRDGVVLKLLPNKTLAALSAL